MESIVFSNEFYEGLEDVLKINENIINTTLASPNKIHPLEANLTLYFKKFNNGNLSNLLLGINQGEQKNFAFAYWIPESIILESMSLLNILESFANEFGCIIKTLSQSGKFINEGVISTKSRDEVNIEDITNVIEYESTSYELHLIGRRIPGSFQMEVKYLFAVNRSRYITWLYNVKTAKVKFKEGYRDYITNLRDSLDPYGRTRLTISNSKLDIADTVFPHIETNGQIEEFDLEIPKKYLGEFSRITKVINSMGENGKISILKRFQQDDCIFCGSTDISSEHIFAQWMRPYFAEQTFESYLFTGLPGEDALDMWRSGIFRKKETSYGFVSRRVCGRCNGTWMSRLESRAKEILVDENNKFKYDFDELILNKNNTKDLALWIVSKALLVALKADVKADFPKNMSSSLKEGKILESFLVEMTSLSKYDLNFSATFGLIPSYNQLKLRSMDKSAAEFALKDFFCVSIQIGNFAFRVSYLDESKKLKRETYAKKTLVIHPSKYEIQHFSLETDVDNWKLLDENIEFEIFQRSFNITDHELE